MLKSTLCLLLLGTSTAALAQNAPAPETPVQEDGFVDEIVVTAQKRAESVQDVPISIAAFSAAKLTENNVLTVQDLGRITPNFSASRASQVASVRLGIRGVGAAGNTAAEPSVAAFLDGVYIPRPGAIVGNFLDMEGVEILRGPQGTLFGRNASVGAVAFRSAQPKDEFSGEVKAEVGNADRYELRANLNVPLADGISLRAAGLGSWFGGFWNNALDGETYGETDSAAGRMTLKVDRGAVTWLVRGDYARSTGDGYQPQIFDESSVSPAQLTAFRNLQIALSGSANDPVLFDRTVNQSIVSDYEDINWGLSSDLSYDLGGYTLRLVNSYRKWDSTQLDGDLIFTPIPVLNRNGSYLSDSHNHELQIISPQGELLGGRLDFVAGLYYFAEDFAIGESLDLRSQFCNALVPAGPRPTCQSLLNSGQGQNATVLDFFQSLESFAAYGQANIKLADPLTLVLGGRWTSEKKDGRFVQLQANPFAAGLRAPEDTPLVLKDDRFTYRVGLNFEPSDDVLIFANHSTGYKSGGFNSGGGAVAVGAARIFARETVKNYELGAKTSWFDNRLRANLTLYRMDIGGFQDRSFDGVTFLVRNAGNLRHQGFEFDTVIAPSRRFEVTAALAYLDSKFTSYPGGAALPGTPGVRDLTGERANYTPEWQGNLGATWRGEIGQSGIGWSLNGNVAFVSDQNVGQVIDANPQTEQDGYALLGARFALLDDRDDRWEVALFGNNLANKGYCINTFYQVLDGAFGLRNGVFPGSTGVRCSLAPPRTYGVAATLRF
jgi:iron complex outermembrane recepter protein